MYIKKECPNCHHSIDADKTKCPLCGYIFASSFKEDDTKINDKPDNQSTEYINFCPNCGTKLNYTSNFCPKCGFNLNRINADAEKQEATSTNEENTYESQEPDKYVGFAEEEEDEFYGCGESDQTKKNPQKLEKESVPSSETVKYKSNVFAGILTITLGFYGIHNFYLRRFKSATIQLIFGLSSSLMFYVTQIEKIQYEISSNSALHILLIFMYVSFICGGINILWQLIDFISICLRSKSMKSPDRPMSYHSYDKIVFLLMISLVICSGIFYGVYQGIIEKQSQEALAIVRNMTLKQYPDVSLPMLVNSLVASPKWKKINNSTINVSGEVSYLGKPATIEIGFSIKPDDTASVYAIEIDDTPQTYFWKKLFIERMHDLATANQIQLN